MNVLVSERKMDALQDFHRQSAQHRSAIAEILLMHCEILADCACAKPLDQLLMFAQSLLSPADLSKLAIATAAKADQCDELKIVLRYLDAFTEDPSFLSRLRDAAGQSGDPNMLELTVSYDHVLTQQLDLKPGAKIHHRPQFNRLLALSLQAGSAALKEKVQRHGAVIHASDPALKGLPLFAILADTGDLLLLRSHFRQVPEQLTEAIRPIKSGHGLMTVVKAWKSELSPADLHTLLCRAVRIGDKDTVECLVAAGAIVDFVATQASTGKPPGADLRTPVSTAIKYGKAHLFETLFRLGGKLERSQLDSAQKLLPGTDFGPYIR